MSPEWDNSIVGSTLWVLAVIAWIKKGLAEFRYDDSTGRSLTPENQNNSIDRK
ncbi:MULTISPECIES: hypothetical protein [Okeania]|uniref:hypothetical protein n=1 Tax=Okeania TaxID=1458928 RepID=UPI00137521EA|nr:MULTISPECIES: hypothetical protein [Okeania]NET13419.1 hypothetical protein [Okeania sp. SIO1H6]NET20676.1 hypothetical protein [Okeania sp. SIO1H5]NET75669.1 hypothetical protein [Okeania sp. SIO1F9]NET93854.1 hypothetical protein [Okeania sp. SIO1H2]